MEHVQLLDALGIADGVAVVTKADGSSRPGAEVVAAVARLLTARPSRRAGPRGLGSPGDGLRGPPGGAGGLRDRMRADRAGCGPPASALAVDRVFSIRGRGTVVTGTLRGGALVRGDSCAPCRACRRADPRARGAGSRPAGRAGRAGSRGPERRRAWRRGAHARHRVDDGPGGDREDRLLVALRPAAPSPPGRAAASARCPRPDPRHRPCLGPRTCRGRRPERPRPHRPLPPASPARSSGSSARRARSRGSVRAAPAVAGALPWVAAACSTRSRRRGVARRRMTRSGLPRSRRPRRDPRLVDARLVSMARLDRYRAADVAAAVDERDPRRRGDRRPAPH